MPPTNLTNDNAASLKTLARFLPYLWPQDDRALRLRVVVALLLVLAGKAVTLFGPYPYKWAIDAMSGPASDSAFGPAREAVNLVMALVAGYAAARFGGVVFDNIRNVVFERVGQDATRKLAVNVFAHLHALSLRFHLSRRTGAVTKVIERGTKSIDVMLYFLLFNIAPTIIELIVVLVTFQLKFGAWLVAATLVMVVAYGWFTMAITNWRNTLRAEMNELDTGTVARAVDSLLNYETVKYFNAEIRETRAYDAVASRYARAAVKSENSLAWLNIGQSLITNVMMAGAMAFIVWGWSRGRFTTGDVVFVSTYLAQLFRPLDMLGMVYRNIRQGLIDMAAMFDLIDAPTEIKDRPDAQPLAVGHGAVRFEGVSFAYDPERQILKGVDFDVPAGTTLAVVGPSGAGKSTLARLIYRFYDVTAGRITIGGQDIRDVTQSSLRASIGIVPQDTVLFNDTIGYNIAYGREGADQADVEQAAKGAAIHDFIAALPRHFDEMVGERGLKLSGGEKQRVAIARTLLKDPPILILDEATSALDSRTEAEIQASLKRLAAKRTTIVIAHRLSTIVDAEQIIVLEAGQVAERGTHAELLVLNGLYAEMWARQAAEAEAETVI